MFWIAWQGYNGGKAISLGEVEQIEAAAYGMHGYPTQAEAEANPNTVPAIAKAQVNAWIFNAQGTVTSHAASAAEGAVENVSGFSSVQNALSAFYDKITDGKMWRSLGWLLLGAALIITGIGLWIGPAAERRSPLGIASDFARRAYG